VRDVGVRDRQAADAAVAAGHVHHAPVGVAGTTKPATVSSVASYRARRPGARLTSAASAERRARASASPRPACSSEEHLGVAQCDGGVVGQPQQHALVALGEGARPPVVDVDAGPRCARHA
jgi:hypothetical protein